MERGWRAEGVEEKYPGKRVQDKIAGHTNSCAYNQVSTFHRCVKHVIFSYRSQSTKGGFVLSPSQFKKNCHKVSNLTNALVGDPYSSILSSEWVLECTESVGLGSIMGS